jgi:glycosyltransferase involved in cell wall biosynthesis
MRMRTLHIVSTLAAGGIASSLCYVLPSLSNLPDIHVEVATLYAKGQFGELLAQSGIPIHELHLGRKYAPQALPRLRALLHQGHYDVVHAHGWPGLFLAALASLEHRGPLYVIGEHNVTNRRRQQPWLRPLERWMYNRYARIIAVSDKVAQELIAWLPTTAVRTRVIHNGVDPGFFNHPPETRARTRASLSIASDTLLLLFVGGLHHQKGADLLFHALAGLPSETWKRQPLLLICGDGSLRSSLHAQAVELGLIDSIRFLGYRQDVPQWMAAADLLVLPSRWEGCPMVVLEAMASGLPIVATAVGGVPELIEDGVHGRLVPPGNPTALADAIDWMLTHPDLAGSIASRAHERLMTEFTAQVAARNLSESYRQAAGTLGG